MSDDTIYALSSGRPPAAIAVMRISGPRASDAILQIAGSIPTSRVATLRTLCDQSRCALDRAMVVWFPGPASATGEDVAELHLHGGVAVVAAVSHTLAAIGLRHAEPGEFTRRAVLNGRLDINEAEGLADLLAAETEVQRREAMLRSTGLLSRKFDAWTDRILEMSAIVERAIDHDDEDQADHPDIAPAAAALRGEIADSLRNPATERLRDGIRVAIVGPVNAGKSSLFNALVGSDAAIVTPIPGTTRDVLERSIAIDGLPFLLCDTAGDRESDDPVERIGIDRARRVAETADIVLDLSEAGSTDDVRIAIGAKADLALPTGNRVPVSALTGTGLAELRALLSDRGRAALSGVDEIALNTRQRDQLEYAQDALDRAIVASDPLTLAEHLREARKAFDRLTGRASIDDVFDALFSRFCLGK